MSELGPLFAEPELQAALAALADGSADAAIDKFGAYVAAPASAELVDEAKFVLAYALYEDERWVDALEKLEECANENELFRDHCAWWAAKSAAALGDVAAAIAIATTIGPDSNFGQRAMRLRGELAIVCWRRRSR